MYEDKIEVYFKCLKEIVNQSVFSFAEVASQEVPKKSGVYLIKNSNSNEVIYAGRSRNLRTRLLQQHKKGNIRGSQFRKALSQKNNLGNETEITDYILSNCCFQFFVVEDFKEMVRLEHFVTAILAPTLNIELKQ